VRPEYGLPERYLFYPAQFWPHKNHVRIVQALGLLKDRLRIPIVFCGSNSGPIRQETYAETVRLIRTLGLEHDVRLLGYVPDSHMAGLYRGAVALIFPTFFGPTNIPVLEAWALDCPVLSSDIRGIREQVGEAGVLVNPRSVEALADGIQRLWTDDGLRKRLIQEGRKRLTAYTPEDYDRRLAEILREARSRIRSVP
jgi:glycosyltransferase involved in cell wall biosynthesis